MRGSLDEIPGYDLIEWSSWSLKAVTGPDGESCLISNQGELDLSSLAEYSTLSQPVDTSQGF